MISLTKAEEEVMQHLWELEKGFVKDLLKAMPEPKPAYNTVSTIIRILEKKGFVGHESFGNSHQYYPIISKDVYRQFSAKNLVHKYFDNSVSQLVSFFAGKGDMTEQEIDELQSLINNMKKND